MPARVSIWEPIQCTAQQLLSGTCNTSPTYDFHYAIGTRIGAEFANSHCQRRLCSARFLLSARPKRAGGCMANDRNKNSGSQSGSSGSSGSREGSVGSGKSGSGMSGSGSRSGSTSNSGNSQLDGGESNSGASGRTGGMGDQASSGSGMSGSSGRGSNSDRSSGSSGSHEDETFGDEGLDSQ